MLKNEMKWIATSRLGFDLKMLRSLRQARCVKRGREMCERFMGVWMQIRYAPATREDEVIDTLRRGMRDAAEELEEG